MKVEGGGRGDDAKTSGGKQERRSGNELKRERENTAVERVKEKWYGGARRRECGEASESILKRVSV